MNAYPGGHTYQETDDPVLYYKAVKVGDEDDRLLAVVLSLGGEDASYSCRDSLDSLGTMGSRFSISRLVFDFQASLALPSCAILSARVMGAEAARKTAETTSGWIARRVALSGTDEPDGV